MILSNKYSLNFYFESSKKNEMFLTLLLPRSQPGRGEGDMFILGVTPLILGVAKVIVGVAKVI